MDPTQPAPPTPSDALGPEFVVEQVLGRGGMGIVYAAYDRTLGRRVAVKVTLDERSRPQLRDRLQREGQALAQLDSPGIVRVHRVGSHAGRSYLVCELVEGARTLNQVWAARGLDERVRFVRDAAHALGSAHASGIVHRDVKPENLLVDREGRLRVTDFGVALVSETTRLTKTGGVVGTPHYMAPEQIRGERETVGPHTDVWSLGVLLYEALTRTLPFEGENVGQLGFAITQGSLTHPRALDPQISELLERVCLKALSAAPGDRYANGHALADDLDAVREGRAPRAKAPRSAALRWVLAAGVLLAIGGGLAVWGTSSKPAPPAPREPAREPAQEPALSSAASDARERSQAVDSWRRLPSALARYVNGHTLLERWKDAPELSPVRQAREIARSSQEPLATFQLNRGHVYASFGSENTIVVCQGASLRVLDVCSEEPLREDVPSPGWRHEFPAVLTNGDVVLGGKHLTWIREGADVLRIPKLHQRGIYRDTAGKFVVVPHADGPLELYDAASRTSLGLLGGEHEPALCVAVSPDGKSLAAFVGQDPQDEPITEMIAGELIVWDLPSRSIRVREDLWHRVRNACFTNDGTVIAAGNTSGHVFTFDATSGEPLTQLTASERNQDLLKARAHTGSIRGLVALGDHRVLSAAGVSPGNTFPHVVGLWDLDSGRCLWELRNLAGYPSSLCASLRLQLFAVGTADGSLTLYALPELE